jgi:hypothetical protein
MGANICIDIDRVIPGVRNLVTTIQIPLYTVMVVIGTETLRFRSPYLFWPFLCELGPL